MLKTENKEKILKAGREKETLDIEQQDYEGLMTSHWKQGRQRKTDRHLSSSGCKTVLNGQPKILQVMKISLKKTEIKVFQIMTAEKNCQQHT